MVEKGYIKEWNVSECRWSDILSMAEKGESDMTAGEITIKEDRMKYCSFSIPTFNGGLGIMTLKEEIGFLTKVKIMIGALQIPAFLFLCFLVIFSHIVWIAERDKDDSNDNISDDYFPGIFQAFYFCVVTCSTVGYGDFTPRRWQGKLSTLFLILFGIIAFCNFQATLTANYTVEYSNNDINSVNDLKGKVVITKDNSTSYAYLKKIDGIELKVIGENESIERAIDDLLLKRGKAVVFDYPVLLNYVKQNPDKVEIVGKMFDPQYYAFVLAKNKSF